MHAPCYRREFLKGNTDILLLTLLSNQPMCGYQIVKDLDKKSDGYFLYTGGTLYPALHRLERNGLIGGKWEKSSSGHQRRCYHVTKKGQKVLKEKMDFWLIFSKAVNSIVLKV
jgi:PadR family transcriptional regulator, regulatory protein PadR